MADVNKSIEISYRADLKQLLANLKQMPNMTEKQAKEMVAGLQKQLRQAEKAADSASKNTTKSFKKMETAAKQTTINARSLRREFANIDRLTSEASQGLSLISPALGDAAMQASVAASGVESLGRALSVSNPLFIIGAVVVGGLIAAFSASSKQAEALAESEERLAETLRESIQEFENLKQAASDADAGFGALISDTNDLRNELLLMQGEISELELQSLQNLQDIYNFEQQLRQNADQRLKVENDTLKNIQDRKQAIKEEIKLLDESRSYFSFNSDINQKQNALKRQSLELALQEKDIENGIGKLRSTQQDDIARAVEERTKVVEALQQEREKQAAIREQEERRRKAAKASADAERERLAILKEQEDIYNQINDGLKASQSNQDKAKNDLLDLLAKQDGKEAELQRKMEKQSEAIDEQINAAKQRLMVAKLQAETDEQIYAAQELAKNTVAEIETLEMLQHEQRLAMAQEIADLKETQAQKDLENIEKIKEAERKAIFDNFNDLSKLNDASVGLTDILIQKKMDDWQIEKENYDKMSQAEKEAFAKKSKAAEQDIIRLFRLSQSAALANVAFAVAEGIAESAGNPIKLAAVIAAGVSSTAKIVAQKPPTADMGMIGNNDPLRPDETTTRVLRGEAVIDRATVNRLGGEQGIRNLQEGGSVGGGRVVVVQPFKHFDRFIKQASQSGAIFRQTKPVRY